MPEETLVVNGKEYLYFSFYDSATKQKKRLYCGPKFDPEAKKRAGLFEERHKLGQQRRKTTIGRYLRIMSLGAEAAIYNTEECKQAIQCLVDAFADLQWVKGDYTALFGWLNGDEQMLDRLEGVRQKLQDDMKNIQDVEPNFREFLREAHPDWFNHVRYRKSEDEQERPERDPAWRYHIDQSPGNIVLEMLKGGIDAHEHALMRIDASLEIARKNHLDVIVEAIEFLGLTKAITDSRAVFQEALELAA